jgi:tetratricopeptide (TPR) repeat protein
MHQRSRFCFFSTICAIMLVSVAVAQTPSQEMELGRKALQQGKFDEAIQHFENANSQMPPNSIVQLQLASAFAQKYVPGIDNADNTRVADQAIRYYQMALDGDSSKIAADNAAKGIGFLYARMNKFDESKDYYGRAKKLNPQDPEPFYLIAVIDWTLASQFRQQERAKLKLKPEESLAAKDPKACLVVKDKNASNVAEAIDNLNTALELRPIYPDAMTYMNLVYLERADIQCDDATSRKADLKAADDWAKKALLAKQAKAAKHADPEE